MSVGGNISSFCSSDSRCMAISCVILRRRLDGNEVWGSGLRTIFRQKRVSNGKASDEKEYSSPLVQHCVVFFGGIGLGGTGLASDSQAPRSSGLITSYGIIRGAEREWERR